MLKKLENKLKELGKVAIAYSGGIDSSFLLYIANTVLSKKNVIAVIANGSMIPRKDYDEAIQFLVENEFQYKDKITNIIRRCLKNQERAARKPSWPSSPSQWLHYY